MSVILLIVTTAKYLVVFIILILLVIHIGKFALKHSVLPFVGQKYIPLKCFLLSFFFIFCANLEYFMLYASFGEWHEAIIRQGLSFNNSINIIFDLLGVSSFICFAESKRISK